MWLEICQKIGREANPEILKIYNSRKRSKRIGTIGYGGDETIEGDSIAEKIVIKNLDKLYGKIKLISEEVGTIDLGKGTSDEEYLLVVDPLDGSFNFEVGIDYFGISIAVLNPDTFETEFGYIRNFINGNEYWADTKTAFKDGKKIKTSNRISPENILLETSSRAFPKDVKFMSRIFQYSKHSRAPGAVCLNFCNIAEGLFDAFLWAGASRFMDMAAGMHIAKKAGAIITDFNGKSDLVDRTTFTSSSMLTCGNQDIYDSIIEKK